MKILTVFFDVGGTLINSPDFFETVAWRLVGHKPNKKAYNLVFTMFMQIYQKRDSQNPFLRVEDMLAQTLTSVSKLYGYKDISAQSHALVFEVYLHKSSLFPEVISVLEKLFNNGAKMVIASDADTDLMEKELRKHHLKKYFIDKCVSESVKAYKPAFGFTNYLRKYTIDNENCCYFVGDNLVDIESGKQLGIKSVLVDRKSLGNKYDADFVIHDLNGLLPIVRV